MTELFNVRNLHKDFKIKKGVLKAVNDVSFSIYEGETLGIVGESGCGKTTCGRLCIGMYKKTGGQVTYRGREVSEYRKNNRMEFTGKVQCIFQDPYASLDPRMRIGELIAEGIDAHHLAALRDEREEKVARLLEMVGLRYGHRNRYPHEFSGGQRQRIGIARALAVEPEFVFCDEPISALDVSVQSQIMNLLMDMQRNKNLTYMFVSHDISMVKHISDRIAVFYMGKIMEIGDAGEIYYHPVHPYTKALLSSLPIPDPHREQQRKELLIQGDVPSPVNYPKGCAFQSRCPYAEEKCRKYDGNLLEVSIGHYAACTLAAT